MRRAAALIVSIGFGGFGACGTPTTTRPPSPANETRPGSSPPTVRFASMQLVAIGLPAIAADGSTVVHAVVDGDGGRGNPNLVLVSRDRDDRERERFVVITANDAEGQYDERGPSVLLQKRIRAGDAWLDARHGRNDLRPLVKLASEPNPLATDEGNHAHGEGLRLDLTPRRLTIRQADTIVVDRAIPPSWTVADRTMCATCEEVCRHAMFLEAAHADVAHRLVLLTVAYSGTDMCPEPVSQHHVVAW